ncbi:hypothetical protein QCA50_008909 [Cerrena zonata]|uniref:Opi1-domain-containing protein n=1 Tax=Cerrena zonata TaxID=2478898 RepID=A0AAW0GCM0_9APHY
MPAQRTHNDLAALDDQDESVRIAVHALGDMRNSGGRPGSNLYQSSPSSSFQPTPALSITSRSSSPSLPSPSIAGESIREDADNAASSPDFVSRMSTFPLVGSALRVYESSKASSRVVKYGAEMMESSVKSISRPVIDRLPVNQLDEFACRQLDRLESYSRRAPSREASRHESDVSRDYEYRPEGENREREAWSSSVEGSSSGALRGRSARQTSPDRWKGKDRDTSMRREDEPSRTHSRTPTPRQEPEQQQQVVQRSRWQAMVLEVGGIGAAFSEESMRRLKYCLQWLQYATAHIDQQILVLRNFIDSLQAHSSGSPSPEHLQTLTTIRRDVVQTIREVVNVVSKYAGGALPEPARGTVRSFILRLPARWQRAGDSGSASSANGSSKSDGRAGRATRTGNARASAAPYTYGPGESGPSSRSRPASRATSPSHSRAPNGQVVPMQQAAQKILTLAVESLDMLRAVTAVFKESLDKADAWVERLRSVGINRPDVDIPMLPPASTLLSPTSDRSPSRSPGSGIAPITLPPPSSNGTSTSTSPISPNFPPPSSLLAPSRSNYRETLPPIALSPTSTNPPSPSGMSPYQNLTELQLPPLRSGAFAHSRQGSNGSQGHPHTEFGALSLNGSAGSRSMPVSGYATPRSAWPDNEDKDAERGRVWERDWERERMDRERRWEEERSAGEERRDGRMDVDQ